MPRLRTFAITEKFAEPRVFGTPETENMLHHHALSLLVASALARVTSGCSAYIAGKEASIDGSVMLSHSDDGDGTSDPRIAYVPAADHAPHSRRPVWPDLEAYPRYVGDARGATYTPLPGQTPTKPIGSIPQVNHTYAYYEANYAIQVRA